MHFGRDLVLEYGDSGLFGKERSEVGFERMDDRSQVLWILARMCELVYTEKEKLGDAAMALFLYLAVSRQCGTHRLRRHHTPKSGEQREIAVAGSVVLKVPI